MAASLAPTARVAALGVAMACATPLVVAALLVPSTTGMDTHRQLGLPGCGWPAGVGIPCVTCGMTTAFAHGVRGQFVAGLGAQPAGLALCLLSALGVVVAAWDAVSGRPVHRLLLPLASGRVLAGSIAFLLAAWAWKVAQVKGWMA
jgi:hypothetical protein